MLEIIAVGVVRESRKFSGHPCIGRIARSSLRQHSFLVLTLLFVDFHMLQIKTRQGARRFQIVFVTTSLLIFFSKPIWDIFLQPVYNGYVIYKGQWSIMKAPETFTGRLIFVMFLCNYYYYYRVAQKIVSYRTLSISSLNIDQFSHIFLQQTL